MAAQRTPKPAAAPKKPTPDLDTFEPPILKRGSCPTLSGKSTLRYECGLDPTKAPIVRVTACTGGGFFSDEWVSLAGVRSSLQKAKPITAVLLFPLFRGKSVNTPGYLLAVLRAEKLIQALPGKTRVHDLCGDWDERVTSLLGGDSGKAKPSAKSSPKSSASPKTNPKPTKKTSPRPR